MTSAGIARHLVNIGVGALNGVDIMDMRPIFLAGAALALATAIGSSNAQAATTFNFSFDNNGPLEPDGTVGLPLVADGTFVSPVDLTPGTYALSSLPGFTLSFDFSGDTFSEADIETPISDVAVTITNHGGGERLVFTENPPGGDTGPFAGSLDLVNSSGSDLTFEPTFAGGHNLYAEIDGDSGAQNFGNYLALAGGAVPEPAGWAMMLIGLGGLGMVLRNARRRPYGVLV